MRPAINCDQFNMHGYKTYDKKPVITYDSRKRAYPVYDYNRAHLTNV